MAETVVPAITPDRLRSLVLGYLPARAVIAAVELRLFDALATARRPMRAEALATCMSVSDSALRSLLGALVALGLLEQDGDAYQLSAGADALLVRESPGYLGDLLDGAAEDFEAWSHLTEVLRTGMSRRTMFETAEEDTLALQSFLGRMAQASRPAHDALIESFDFGSACSVVDIGGGCADLAVLLARRYPHIRVTVFDRPAVAVLARQAVVRGCVEDQVDVVAGDFWVDPFPSADVVVLSMVLLDWPEERKIALLRAARGALRPGGHLIVVDRNPPQVDEPVHLIEHLHRLSLTVRYGDVHHFTGEDLERWCESEGFTGYVTRPLTASTWLAVAKV